MPSTVVGLDIGRTAVRAVELRTGKHAVVRRAGRVPLPAGAVEAGAVSDPEAVTAALRTLWREARIGSRAVRLGVCSGSVLVRQIELDWMPQADLRRALRYQVADLLPVAVDDANLDHVHLGDDERVDPTTGTTRKVSRILLVATARGGVDELVRCVRAAGLRPQTADLSPLALVRAAHHAARGSVDGSEAGSEAVIDVGTDKTAVAVHTGGVPRFVRVATGLGGDTLTRAVVEQTGMSWDEADQAKTDPVGPGTRPEVALALTGAVERLVADIRTTLDYHASVDPAHVPTRAVLTGGAATNPGLLAHCARLLDMPVRRLEAGAVARRHGPAPRDRADEAQAAPCDDDLLVPMGLCLGVSA